MNKKEMAISFLRLASSGNVREAYETEVHPDFRHHNPYFPGDRASLLAGMEESAVKFPKKEFEAVRALEDGDLVAVHGRVLLTPSNPWIALIHIFRFEGNQIIEEWEVGQEVPKESPNENGINWCVANSFISEVVTDIHPIDGIGRKRPLRPPSGFAWLKKNPSTYRRGCGMRKPVENRSRSNLRHVPYALEGHGLVTTKPRT